MARQFMVCCDGVDVVLYDTLAGALQACRDFEDSEPGSDWIVRIFREPEKDQ